jgi:hypothetical protein
MLPVRAAQQALLEAVVPAVVDHDWIWVYGAALRPSNVAGHHSCFMMFHGWNSTNKQNLGVPHLVDHVSFSLDGL